MPQFEKTIDIQQGFKFKRDRKTTTGFITALKVGELTMQADLSYESPIDPGNPRKAVAILNRIQWETGIDDAVSLSGQISINNKQAVTQLLFSGVSDIAAEICFSVYDYDQGAKKYYASAHSRNITLKGMLARNGNDINLSVADDASTEISEPQNYTFNIGIIPLPIPQQIYLAISNNREAAKGWGVAMKS